MAPRKKPKTVKKTTTRLAKYQRMRDFSATPEPAAGERKSRGKPRFVVQMHRATRLHYDFRLEAAGVLASWAIPKGPSYDVRERRLAMHVEDHPYDYRDFEGIIPQGHYGAGEVIVWDRGTYQLTEGDDPAKEIAKGKITFVMYGEKLHGEFTLVKMRARAGESGEPWLLIKDKDEYVDPKWRIEDHPESVKSGKTLADLAQDKRAKQWISPKKSSRAARPAAASRKQVELPRIAGPQTATTTDEAFDDPDWLFEIKWDGFRALATIGADGSVKLTSRNNKELLGKFPELADLANAFRSLPIVVDGEIVALDEQGRSSFQRLQNRIESVRGPRRPVGEDVTFVAFDVLFADGRNLVEQPLEARKKILEGLLVEGHHAMYSKHVVGEGKKLFALAEKRGLEGIMAKRREAAYEAGRRTRTWLKIKAQKRQEFVVGGWTDPRGSRKGFGALIVGYYERGRLIYAGHVGTGFSHELLRAITRRLEKLERKSCPFAVTPPKSNAPAHWISPELVAEVRFTEWTDEGYLRHPAFLGLREDKDPKSVVREKEIPHEDVA
ncbi:MAG: non-homologous end-joining DNA ligase [Candidatus Eremiobacteraeota bacterium]|nr:non-homologous end-joining DNA ligase [Candidatus Eremiobacteraeota bacterium]